MILLPLLGPLVCKPAPAHPASAFSGVRCAPLTPSCHCAENSLRAGFFSVRSFLPSPWAFHQVITEKGISGAAVLWDRRTGFGLSLDSRGEISGLWFPMTMVA